MVSLEFTPMAAVTWQVGWDLVGSRCLYSQCGSWLGWRKLLGHISLLSTRLAQTSPQGSKPTRKGMVQYASILHVSVSCLLRFFGQRSHMAKSRFRRKRNGFFLYMEGVANYYDYYFVFNLPQYWYQIMALILLM